MTERTDNARICFVLTPHGAFGGGMGRVKDYILQSGGDRLGRIRFVSLDTHGGHGAARSIIVSLKAIMRIWADAFAGRVALVHVNMGDSGSVARKGMIVLMSRLVGLPVVLHLHATKLERDYARANPLLRWLIALPFRRATCCIVLGKIWRDWLVNSVGVESDRVEVVYNGVPVDPAPLANRSAAGRRRILFLGNLLERKGISDLLHALASLPPGTADWTASIAGGGDVARYQDLARELGIADRTSFLGWVDQPTSRTLLVESDVLVLPSYDEGMPLVVLEALGMGTPVICTPVGAIPEVLEDQRTSLFVAPGDRDELAVKLRLVLDDPDLRRRLSHNGAELFQRLFTLDVFLNKIFDIYRRHCNIEIERKFPVAAAPTQAA